jgi:hypothetical protein
MSEPPEKRVKDDVAPTLSTFERKRIFDSIYNGNPSLDIEDNLFKKDSKELGKEAIIYTLYYEELKLSEEVATEIKLKVEASRLKNAEAKFSLRAGVSLFDPSLLNEVCFGLGSLLFDFVDDEKELTDDGKKEVAIKIKNILDYNVEECKSLLSNLGLFDFVFQNIRVPLNSKRSACVPSSMNVKAQIEGDSYFSRLRWRQNRQ